MEISNKITTFNVVRKNPELIAPAKPTPHESKLLSDIDDQQTLHFHVIEIQFYRRNPSAEGKDPVKVIRDAIAKALVFYYPFAGQLRESTAGKLVVECTGEGVIFIEADADVALQQLGDALYPPFLYLDKLLYNVPGTAGIIDSPLLLIQVTRLRCGGFVFAIRFNHTMCDGAGLVQFMSAVGELARGAEDPSILPIWQRHLLNARNPARVTCTHYEYGNVPETGGLIPAPPQNLVDRCFLFNTTDISALRTTLPPDLRHCSNFEIVVACTWRCRTIALYQNPSEEIQISCVVDCRKRCNPPLPEGYYGNAFVYPAAATTAENLSRRPLHYALELVRNAKSQANGEYIKSVADLTVLTGRVVLLKAKGTYLVSDLTRAGFDKVDFGWGPAVYGGPAECTNKHGEAFGYVLPYKNVKGENGIVVTMRLPENAMDKFKNELETIIVAARKNLIIGASTL